ncbi:MULTISPECIES: FAD-dependent monooxygenase [unclassified Streptomyces]|uniref:FAD-dependent monooxygenase n=1 Tax=unclassified Streptomyces TaxID=2593676 RepID=UPI0022B73616|nr:MULTISPECIES: FAD-dependent monooxygenase [unclassified Streptomyces]MCZ7414865.1 FAD-dependent monooxygenase [Streptomyces sp. WMMC897]MCZ7431808.1 FAD-dependent monooxygenase [Streptomyces sp. WMMC1477]
MEISSATIVGGGTTGTALAVLLRRRGVHVELVEARPDFGALGAGVLLHGNALRVLRAVGVCDTVLAAGTPFASLGILRPDGSLLTEQPDLHSGGPDLPPVCGITRPRLQRILAQAVTEAGVRVHLGQRVEEVEQGAEGVRVALADGRRLHADVVIAADGAHSGLRRLVDPGVPEPTGWAVWRALIPRPADVTRTCLAYGGVAHIAGFAPMGADTGYTMFVVDAPPVASEPRREDYARHVDELAAAYGGPVWKEIRGHLAGAEIHHTRFTHYVARRWHTGRLALAGDAAHCMPPTLAQGAAMCLEDAQVLADSLTAEHADVAEALAAYQARRLPRVRAVADASMRLGELLATGRHREGPALIHGTLTALSEEP